VKIYSMTATFGKLEHETLTLKPGLNIIHAPNEWGKSTWCAFLTAMLYGIDTSARTTKTALADKERFAPWSGSPMSGRMELYWNGRDITIERSTRGRLIFGDFRAYETESGIDVPELTASNCGQMLLGVERSVFLRAGFLRQNDLPVTQDDSLRRRLNNLVTTGDESGVGDVLAQKLKELKNKCRYNRSGLLPQAEAQRDDLQRKLNELQDLHSQAEKSKERQLQLQDMQEQLNNHKQALLYSAAQADSARVAEAEKAVENAQQFNSQLKAHCDSYPSRKETEEKLRSAQALQDALINLQQTDALPPEPVPVPIPAHYAGLSDPVNSAKADQLRQTELETKHKAFQKAVWFCITLSAIIFIGLITLELIADSVSPIWYLVGLLTAAVLCGGCMIAGFIRTKQFRKEMDELYDKHPGLPPHLWINDAEAFESAQWSYVEARKERQRLEKELSQQHSSLQEQLQTLTEGLPLKDAVANWRTQLQDWDTLTRSQQELARTQAHLSTLRSIVKPVAKPEGPDTLTCTLQETEDLLNRASAQFHQNQLRLGQLLGQADALGTEDSIRRQLKEVTGRIQRLEDTYQAIEIAQKAVSAATNELQRRFAPRISKRAQELFSKLTGGRYQRLTLGEDLSLSSAAENEDTLRSSLWRSDGTVDQLYLALRLAVAEELTPDAPLVLDDALVRFDDARLAVALDILKEASQNKQVILFTCQSREEKFM